MWKLTNKPSHQSNCTVPSIVFKSSYFQQINLTDPQTILQTIAQITQTSTAGWILLIAPTLCISKTMLASSVADLDRVLIIGSHQIKHFDNLMRDALTCSTCAVVISFIPESNAALSDYQYLANKYDTRLINFADVAGRLITQH